MAVAETASVTGAFLDVLGTIAEINPIFLFIIFILFVFIAYKIFKILVKALIIGIIAALFPFFANYIGVPMATDLNTMIFFGIFGVLFVPVFKIVHGVVKAGSSLATGGEKGMIRREVRKDLRKEIEKERKKGK